MTHQIYDAAVLAGLQPDRFGYKRQSFPVQTDLQPGAGATVQREVAAMLREIAADPPPQRTRAGPLKRLRNWVPRFARWVRAMPLP